MWGRRPSLRSDGKPGALSLSVQWSSDSPTGMQVAGTA